MRFLTLAASLVLLTTPSTCHGTAEIPAAVPDFSHSRLFGPSAILDTVYSSTTGPTTSTPTNSPTWAAGYGFTNYNPIYNTTILPYPPHIFPTAAGPAPVQERFSGPAIFGIQYAPLATVPFTSPLKRNNHSQPINNTVFTSVSQFPKVGAGLLTSIDVLDDEFFGITRLIGPNPSLIRKVSTLSPKFGDATTLHKKYPNLDWTQIYELDYAKLVYVRGTPLAAPADSILAYPTNGNPGVQQRYITAPYVLLQHVVERGVSKIVPIAIQLGQPYVAGQTAILYRVDYKDKHGVAKRGVSQGDWNYAKTIVNSADATLHQLDAHLVKTHLVAENVIIGTHGVLSQYHPISRLLIGDVYSRGHSYKTLQINEDARNSLIPGIVDEVFAGGYAGAAVLVDQLFGQYNYQADYIPTDLSLRGFDEIVNPKSTDPIAQEICLSLFGADKYFYGRDAIASWKILRQFVSTVLNSYYTNDQAVIADTQVQTWAAYLSSAQPTLTNNPNFPNLNVPVPGFPSSFQTISSLVDAVTAAIYKSTVGHSVVNYPQPFYNAYIPVYPTLALYRPILTASQVGTGLTTDAYIAAALGNANTQQVMTATANGLGQPVAVAAATVLPDDLTLFQYANITASQPGSDAVTTAIQQAATQLLTDLSTLSQKIQARDASFVSQGLNHYQYGYFDPSRVANAIFA